MSKITREMLDAAIQADRAEFGQDLYSKKREIYTDNEYHCEQRFGDEYYGNLSNLHEVTMFSVDLTGDWLLDSKGMASDIRNGFKNIVNNCGEYSNLDVKLDYDEKDGITTITANVYNQDGVYVGCGYLYNGYETDMYKVDELFIKSLKQGIDELQKEELVAIYGEGYEELLGEKVKLYSGDCTTRHAACYSSKYENASFIGLHDSEMMEIVIDEELLMHPENYADNIKGSLESMSGQDDLIAKLSSHGVDFFDGNDLIASAGFGAYACNDEKPDSEFLVENALEIGINRFNAAQELEQEIKAKESEDMLTREEIIEAGGKCQVDGEYSSYDHQKFYEENWAGEYEDLDQASLEEEFHTATYLHNVSFGDVSQIANGLPHDDIENSSFSDALKNAGVGFCIDSYDNLRCDFTESTLIDGHRLVSSVYGYDRKSRNPLFGVELQRDIAFDIGDGKLRHAYLTNSDINPDTIGVIKLDGKPTNQIINDLSPLCDKKHAKVVGEELHVPMGSKTAQIMLDKGMIASIQPMSEQAEEKQSAVTLDEGLMRETTLDKDKQKGGMGE